MTTTLDWRTWFWGIALGALGAGLCFVPLFNLLGFEFAFAIGIAASVAGAHLGASAAWQRRREASRSDGERADARPLGALAGVWLAATARVWALLLIPLALVTLNALRVRNCDFSTGAFWYILLPGISAATGSAVGVAAGSLRAWKRRIFPTLLAFGAIAVSVAIALWRIYAAPPIFAYDPFGGYFPGTLYDEEVAAGAPLYWARAFHLAGAAAAIALCALFLDGPRWRLKISAARGRVMNALVALALTATAIGLYAAAPRLGFRLDAGDIARALGAERRTEHFVLHYSPSGPFAKEIDLYALDHEHRYAELKKLFGVEPRLPVHAFLFDSTAQKAQLMGAAHTSIAKPWRSEIYLHSDGWPHPVLKHELAHVFAGAFGDALFHGARHGVHFNVGLVEGIATAAAWTANPQTPHQTVATLRALGRSLPLARVLSYGFLAENGAAAYATAGSFCRFLLDHYGAAPLEAVYRAGGTDESWRAAYGKSLDALGGEWEKFIDTVEVAASDRELSREHLSRPSVFHKVCAHELALRRQAARARANAGDREGALRLLREVCADDRDDPQNLVEIMDTAAAGGLDDEADRAARELLAHPKISPAQRARAVLLAADRALTSGDRAAARAGYDAALALPLDDGEGRLVTVKRLAADEPPGPDAERLIRFLVPPPAGRDAALDLLALGQLVAAAPDRALYHYLLGRQLAGRGRHDEAAAELQKSIVLGGLPDARFVREAERLRGISLYRAGRLDEARAVFSALGTVEPTEALRVESADWLSRLSFAESWGKAAR